MPDNIVINISADTTGLKSTIDLLEKLGQVDKKTASEFRAATDAFIKQQEAVKAVGTGAEKAAQSIPKVNKALKEGKGSAESFSSALKDIGAALGIAFGVFEVVNFGKESVKAFLDAEKTANQLKFAITQIGDEGEQAFERLVKQSKDFEGFFSDDDIQRAQTMLVQFGLTSNEVDALVPKILDLAAATGKDLNEAASLVIQGINGQTRALKPLGIEFEDTGNKAQNLAVITEKLIKFQGANADILETTAGRAQALANAFNNLQEDVGEFLVGIGTGFLKAGQIAEAFFDILFPKKAEAVLGTTQESFNRFTENIKKSINEAGDDIDILAKKLRETQQANIDRVQAEINGMRELAKTRKDEREARAFSSGADKLRDTNLQNEILKLQIINDLLSKRTKLDVSTLGHGDDAEKARLEALKREEDLKKKIAEIDEENFKLAEDNLQKFVASELESLNTRGLNKEELEKAQTELELQELQIRLQNYIDYGKATGDITKQIAQKKVEINKAGLDKESQEFKDLFEQMKQEVEREADDFIQAQKDKQEAIELLINKMSLIGETLTTLSELFTVNSDAQIEAIEAQRDSQLDSIDQQEEALQTSFEKRKTGEREMESQSEALKKQRVEAEKRAQKQIADLRKKEATVQKIQSIFNIGLKTAEGILNYSSNPLTLPLLPAFIALSAAQLAVAVAKPIPSFFKGTLSVPGHDTGKDSILAMVRPGEAIIPTEKSKQYNPTLDAVYHGKIRPEILNDMVTKRIRGDIYEHKNVSVAVKAEIDYQRLAIELKHHLKGEQKVRIKNWDEMPVPANDFNGRNY